MDEESAFGKTDLDPKAIGGIVLPISLLLLGLSFYGVVKILDRLLKTSIKNCLKLESLLNPEFDSFLKKYLHGYLLILVGAGITFLLQSSSIFTSFLVPMATTGIIEAHNLYPLFCGSNMGTTFTTFMAALAVAAASDGDHAKETMQAAWVHFFFNLFGILVFYPLPFMR